MTFALYLQQQLAQPWLIHPGYVQQVLPSLAGMLRGESGGVVADFAAQREALRPQLAVLGLDGGLTMGPRAARANVGGAKPEGAVSILVLSVKGPMMKDDQECGPAGTETMVRQLKAAYQDPSIDAILIKYDTPGGQAYGTQTLANTIAERTKPVGGFVTDGMCCSAGMWLGTSGDFLMASHGTCRVGSIGTMNAWADMQPAYEKLGVVFHEVYATDSTQKNAVSRAADAGDYKPMIAWLDNLNAAFVGDVKASLAGRLDMKKAEKAGVFNGADMPASEAVEFGLISEIGPFELALQRVADLARNSAAGQSGGASAASTAPMNFFKKTQFGKLAAMAGKPATEITAEAVTEANQELEAAGVTAVALISEAQLDAEREAAATAATAEAAAQLTTANARITELTGQLATATGTNQTLTASVAALTTDRDQLTTQLAEATTANQELTASVATLTTERDEAIAQRDEYGARSGEKPTSVTAEGGESEIKETAPTASYFDPKADHNLTAMELLG